jgi:uncharacterized protein YraI
MNLNKKLIAGGLAALALMATTAGAFAAPAYSTSNVNVRSGPGTGYRAIDTLRRGERVEVEYCRGSWCFVQKSGPDGWVSASYLDRGRPSRPDWDRPGRPDWDRPGRPTYPGWNRPGRPDWDWDRPGRPGWNRPGRPDWGWDRPGRPDSSVCVNGPNGYFCIGD